MSTPTGLLKRSSQQFLLRCQLYEPRQFRLADVSSSGADEGAAAADTGDAAPFIAAFDGISEVGIRGSISEGGFSADITIPEFPATFGEFFGCVFSIRTRHGGSWGTPGASGVAAEPDIFRGWMRQVDASRVYGKNDARFTFRTANSFLSDASLSRGIDYGAGLDHAGPTDSNTIISHLLEYHTNFSSRHPEPPGYGLYIPQHSLNAFSLSEGTIMSMLQQLADNFSGGTGQVYARRGDDLVIGCHPNIAGALHPNLDSPIIDLDRDLIIELGTSENNADRVTQVTVVAQHSDSTEYVASYYGGTGIGGRPKVQIRTDDNGQADYLAAALFAHLNRTFRAVKVTLALVVAVDLGDVITLTVDIPQRGLSWSQKKFLTIGLEYRPNIEKGRWETTLTLDECLL